jgi:hypothetical protein
MALTRVIGTIAPASKNAVMREKRRPIARRLEPWAYVTCSFTARWRVARGFFAVN